MHAYRTDTIRPTLGALLAVIATVGTLAVAVLAPMHTMPNTDPDARLAGRANAIEVVIVPSRIDVVGVRSAKTA